MVSDHSYGYGGRGGDNPLLDRALRLFGYLREVQRLRSQPVRSVEQYDRQGGTVIWLDRVPEHAAVASAFTHEQPATDAPVLILDRVPPSPPPPLSEDLSPWCEAERIDDPNGDPRPAPVRLIDGRLVRFEEEHEVRAEYETWRRSWDSWARKELVDAPIRRLYQTVFTAGEQAAAAPEDLDLVLAVGLLSWESPGGDPIKRHVLVAPLAVDFAEDTGRLTVRFSEGFGGLDVELDMLDASQRPPSGHLQTFNDEAAEYEVHPLDRPTIGELLRRFANVVSNTGVFRPDTDVPQPGPDPIITLAPAVVLRKRSNEGLVRIYNTIEEQIIGSGVVPLGVRQLIDVVESDEDRDESRTDTVSEAYLPLAANDQQLEIVDRVDSAHHTVVQGPPGTGKTHTIANLVSHLLARGKRVLVTAQTDRALRELQDKLPDAIAQLTVSVVGRSRADLADLRVAVEAISAHAASYDAEAANTEISRLEAKLDQLRRERSRLEGKLVAARGEETDHRVFESYEGTLAAIAKRVRAEASNFAWLGDYSPDFTDVAPLTNQGALDWLGLLRDSNIAADGNEASKALPTLDQLPEPDEFERMTEAERLASERAAEFLAATDHPGYGPIRGLPQAERDRLRERMTALADMARDLGERDEQWMSEALRDILNGRSELWIRRHDELRRRLSNLKPTVDRLGPNPRVSVEGEMTADLVPLAESLREHIQGGGRTGGLIKPKPVRSASPLFARVTVDGLDPSTEERLSRFLDWVEAEDALETISKLWPTNVSIPEEDSLLENWAWHETETAQLGRVIELAESLVDEERHLTVLGVPLPDWPDLEGVRAFASVVDAVVAQEEVEKRRAPLEDLDRYLAPLGKQLDRAAVTAELFTAGRDRDTAAWRIAHGRLEYLNAVWQQIRQRDAYSESLGAFAPRLVEAVSQDPSDADWDGRLGTLSEGWAWHRADHWLAGVTTDDAKIAQHQLAVTEDRIRQTITALTAEEAWRHAVNRLGQRERENLHAYALAVRQIGRGTGRYAAHRKKEARRALRSCRSAVPAWIMPTYRIAETLDIDPDIFDVVIVDEASQAGLDTSYLQYLAPKLVVVGDHHQVSPAGVGVEVQKLIDLTVQYLPDIDHVGIWQDPRSSLFDLARMKFGHMITLREHFRCVPEIIGFSNQLVYERDRIPLIPLRQFGNDRLAPIKTTYVADGYEKGTTNKINPPEAEELIDAVEKCCADPRYDGKSLGIISLTGRAQADYIEQALLDRLGPLEFKARDLRCGDAAAFQGSERDVMFLSMVAAPSADKRVRPLVGDLYVQRFNVAGSRARDQLWLFHSVRLDELTNREDMRFELINYCTEMLRRSTGDEADVPGVVSPDMVVDPFDSLFEQHVFNEIVKRGFIVQAQLPVYGYRIDLVVTGGHGRVAIECDGDAWHGADRYEEDMARQRDLERVGWEFFRVRASTFYRDPDEALEPLWQLLDEREIRPAGWQSESLVEVETSREIIEPVGLLEPPIIKDAESASHEVDIEEAGSDTVVKSMTISDATDDRSLGIPAHPELVAGVVITHRRLGRGELLDVTDSESGPILSVGLESGGQFEYTVEEYERAGFELEVKHGVPATEPSFSLDQGIRSGQSRVNRGVSPSGLEPYVAWSGSGFPDPRRATPREIAVGLEAIVEGEGPITADRAYHLFLKAAGFDRLTTQARHALNRGLHSIRSQAEIEEYDNPHTNWPQRVLRLPGTEPWRVRELGPRDLYHVPLNEVAALMDLLMKQFRPPRTEEELMRAVLDTYGLVRLTPKVESYLRAAIDLR